MSTPTKAEPFLRWAGGKRKLVPALLSRVPLGAVDGLYIEPFLGAGSLFFALNPKRAILADANESLVRTYCELRDNSASVKLHLEKLVGDHSAESYYKVRELYNDSDRDELQAARFIYLNKTCFNGIYRVNRSGAFNVPIGDKPKLTIPSDDGYAAVSKALSFARIMWQDYKKTLRFAVKGSFTYLDPPYPALTNTAYFAHYTKDQFGSEDQQELAEQVVKLHGRGAKFLMSNADTPDIRELYAQFSQTTLPVRRFISCKKKRMQVSELLITNY